ncbi:MAG: PA0069 family radical SAM protein [Pirellulaceae bacterium]
MDNNGSENSPALRKGRGAQINPIHRFTKIELEEDLEFLEHDTDAVEHRRSLKTEYFIDDAQSIISENSSPDIPFRYSLNIYRGCLHGCSYCYARPTHEYYNLSAGLDFESKIFVKPQAPRLFRDWLTRDGYQPDTIVISGVTDCYQPIERKLSLTRQCLSVALEARQPISIITKNALVTRDVDLLRELAQFNAARVAISITTLDQSLTRVMEPRTSSPAARLRAIAELSAAGIPTTVMVSPVIPGLTDHEMPEILRQAKEAGASAAAYILLRLPMSVEPVFMEWLQRTYPTQSAKVEARIRATRGGELYDSRFGVRMRGTGEIAEHLRRTFEIFARRYGLDEERQPLSTAHFRRPTPTSGQGWLFES